MNEQNDIDGAAAPQPGFELKGAALGALAAAMLAWVLGTDALGVLVAMGVGFIVGGAAPLLAGIWKYLVVFLALTGGFIWLLAHYVK